MNANNVIPGDVQALVEPEVFPALPIGELHIWQVSMKMKAAQVEDYLDTLAAAELERVRFFEFEPVRNEYIIGKGVLRELLSGYLSIPPNEVKIALRGKGKPYSVDDPGLYFNMSNSGQVAVFAFSRDGELGIDVEQIRPLPDLEDMITGNFTTHEQSFINGKPAERTNRFFRIWTVKESFLKAIGEGMRLSPRELEFQMESSRIRQISFAGVFEQDDWHFMEFSPAEGYAGTLAYGNSTAIIKRWNYGSDQNI